VAIHLKDRRRARDSDRRSVVAAVIGLGYFCPSKLCLCCKNSAVVSCRNCKSSSNNNIVGSEVASNHFCLRLLEFLRVAVIRESFFAFDVRKFFPRQRGIVSHLSEAGSSSPENALEWFAAATQCSRPNFISHPARTQPSQYECRSGWRAMFGFTQMRAMSVRPQMLSADGKIHFSSRPKRPAEPARTCWQRPLHRPPTAETAL